MSVTEASGREPAEGCVRVHVPLRFRRRSGRREIVRSSPENDAVTSRARDPLALALVRAHRWKELIEAGRYANIGSLAARLGVDGSYVGRMLNLTLLAPDIIEALLLGREPDGISLDKLFSLPREWEEQRRRLGFPPAC